MLMEWGQFLAHDVVGTPVGELMDGGVGGGGGAGGGASNNCAFFNVINLVYQHSFKQLHFP